MNMNNIITLITSKSFKQGLYIFAFFTLAVLFPYFVILVLCTLIYTYFKLNNKEK